MLHFIQSFDDLDQRQFMDIYAESNTENATIFFPELTDKTEALRQTERSFLQYLQTEFLPSDKNTCCVLEEQGVWVSALRLYQIEDRLYYIEALETNPAYRKKGYAAKLLTGLIEALKEGGPFTLCDCVDKKNVASVKTHQACGFSIVSEEGSDYLSGERDCRDYGMAYTL